MSSPHSGLTGLNLHGPFHYEQDTDPGAVGAFKYWLDTNSGPPLKLYRRNAADNAWVEVGTDSSALTVQDLDGTPLDPAVSIIRVTNSRLIVNGAGDVTLDLSGGVVQHDYVERTTNLTITATTSATATVCITGNAVAYDGSTRIKIKFFCPLLDSAADATATVNLYDGSTELGQMGRANDKGGPLHLVVFLIPSNGSHTYSIRLWKSGGGSTVVCGNGALGQWWPAFMRITTA